MNTWMALVLGGMVAAGSPTPGVYEVKRDEISVGTKNWGVFCGSPKAFEKNTEGQRVQVSVTEGHWEANGAGRRFGSRICEGQNLSLEVTEQNTSGSRNSFKCQSKRVVQGTEISTHEIIQNSENNEIIFKSINVRSFRKGGTLCELEVKRVTKLAFVPPMQDPKENLAADTQPSGPEEAVVLEGAPSQTENPPMSCNVVGEPVRLVVKGEPKPVVYRGEKRCFQVEAQDKKGCSVDWARIKWKLSSRKLGRLTKRGCLYLSDKTNRKKGRVTARMGNKRKTISFEIKDRPVAAQQLAAAMPVASTPTVEPAVPDAGVAPIQLAQVTMAAKAKGSMPTTNTLRPPTDASGLPLWSGGAILLMILLGWFVLKWREGSKRAWLIDDQDTDNVPKNVELPNAPGVVPVPVLTGNKPKQKPPLRPNQRIVRGKTRKNAATGTLKPSSGRPYKSGTASTIGPASDRLICRKCDFILPAGHRGVCPLDGSLLEPLTPMVPQPTHHFEVKKRICPACCSEFAPEVETCPFDGAHLFPDIGQWDEIKDKIIERNAIAQEEKTPKAS